MVAVNKSYFPKESFRVPLGWYNLIESPWFKLLRTLIVMCDIFGLLLVDPISCKNVFLLGPKNFARSILVLLKVNFPVPISTAPVPLAIADAGIISGT